LVIFVTMRITILGHNSALPAFGRHPTSQAVTVYGEVLLIDCGEGTQIQMQRYGVKWKNVRNIFISHMHGDHYFGLPGLINSMSLMGRTAPLYLHAPHHLQPIIEAILAAANTTLNYPFHFCVLPPAGGIIADTPSYTVSSFPVAHGIPCYGFLIATKTRGRRILPQKCMEYEIPTPYYELLKQGENFTQPDGSIVQNKWVTEDGPPPKKYAYCADTLYTDAYLEHIQGVDALYHESTYLQQDADKAVARFHSTAAQAAQLAAQAGVGLLLLGHFSSKYKDISAFGVEASVHFPNVVVSEEGIAYDI